ncbi:MAG TPA: hypothetical protein VFN67_43185 [Polyangiales bacterium]|nr:hypothetical protein [Polyangiales bacterium]
MSTHTARRISTVKLLLSIAASSLISLSACGSDDEKPNQPEAGAGGGIAAGSGGAKAGSGGSGAKGEPQLGAACKRDADCTGGYFCDAEMKTAVPAQGAPDGAVDQYVFPDGSCTPKRVTTFDPTAATQVGCDPRRPLGAQGCGDEGVCDAVGRIASGFLVGCRKACDPAAAESGCRMGYDCDFTDEYCSEGCRTDADCRVGAPIDTDGDDLPDMLSYDAESSVTCDTQTSRCVHAAGGQASGQSCMRDDECAENGVCIDEESSVAGQQFPGGLCTRRGCNFPGQECDGGTTCEPLRPWLGENRTEPLCFQRCKVGAESADLRVGATGHGDGCREGYRCHYNGGPGAEAGVCVGGNYNGVTKNNIGAECKTNDDCYSPYGLGYCLVYQVPGTAEALPGFCTLFDCAVPGLPTDLCGESNECVATGGGDETNCQHHCKDANDCAKGFACSDDDEDPKTPKSCIPPCLTDAECRQGEKCIIVSTTPRISLCKLQ